MFNIFHERQGLKLSSQYVSLQKQIYDTPHAIHYENIE